MKFIERLSVTSRQELGLEQFLYEHDLVKEVCGQQDCRPGDLILDNLVPNRWPGEQFEDWILRQVRDALVLHVQTDDWRGDGEWEGERTQQTLESIAFSAQDRAWLVEQYGQHPEVRAVWEAACRQEQVARLAA